MKTKYLLGASIKELKKEATFQYHTDGMSYGTYKVIGKLIDIIEKQEKNNRKSI